MLGKDDWENSERILHYQGLFYVPEISKASRWGHFAIEKTWELVARKYYEDLQLLPIPTHCWKGTSYDLILVVDRLKKILCDEPVQMSIDAPWLLDSIVSDWDLVFNSKFWFLQYHFRVQLWLPPTHLLRRTSYGNLITACKKNL